MASAARPPGRVTLAAVAVRLLLSRVSGESPTRIIASTTAVSPLSFILAAHYTVETRARLFLGALVSP